MRRRLLLSLAFVAYAVPALSQEPSDREKLGYKGPVKSVRTQSADPRIDYGITFDGEGRKVEDAYYEPDGTVFRRRVFTYDAGGVAEESYGPDGKLHERVVRKDNFDRARGTGRTTFTVELGGASVLRTEIVNKYDSLGRPVESSSYDREGKLNSRSTWRYGADGRLEEFVFYNGAGSVSRRTVWIPEGARTFVYGNDGVLVSTETQRRQVCEESDQYGNCKREMMARTIHKDGKVEQLNGVITRAFTYH